MKSFYNENDQFACAWLSNLMDAGLITPGKIDDRSIHDVAPDDVAGFDRVHFFAGIGGWDLALNIAGFAAPCWTGSCPCQPFSQAGKRKGFDDERHLWPVWFNLIKECRPSIVFGEQVASAAQWLGLVRSDLEGLEYAVGAMPIEAASAGADHLRDRYWFVAHDEHAREGRRGIQRPGESPGEAQERAPDKLAGSGADDLANNNTRSQGWNLLSERAGEWLIGPGGVADAECLRAAQSQGLKHDERRRPLNGSEEHDWVIGADGKARRVKPGVRLLVDGFPNRVGILRGFGNAIDPRPASEFIKAARECLA